MSKQRYCQCHFVKTVGVERIMLSSTAYIPEKFAQLGQKLKLKTDKGEWDDGWTVTIVGEPTEIVPDVQKAIRTHRKRTGDSLPK